MDDLQSSSPEPFSRNSRDTQKKQQDSIKTNGHGYNGNGNGHGNGHNGRHRRGLISALKNLIGQKSHDSNLRDAIEELITDTSGTGEHASMFSVAEHERALITNILDLRDLPVIDVMVPRADIVAVNISTSTEELINLLTEKPHSRLPVYEDDLDNVIGAVHMKDVVTAFASKKKFELRDILRNVLVVSPSMRVMDLLLKMRQSRVHLAMVVDEFGGIDGLITINDLIEAVVGEIDDEHNFEIQPQLIERLDGSVIADARYEIEEFEEKYGNILNEEDYEDVDTLGGFVNALAGHLPARGEIITYENGIEFEVLDADPRRIKRIRIRNLPHPYGSDED
ncbi:MAG: hemolysin family protein [Pseudomonadota bacterium]